MASTMTRQASSGLSGTGMLAGTGTLWREAAGLDSPPGRALRGAFEGGPEGAARKGGAAGGAAETGGNAEAGGADGKDEADGGVGKGGAGGSSSALASRAPAGRAGL